jgi:hypothetical protein
MLSRFGWLFLTLSIASLAAPSRPLAQESKIVQAGTTFHSIRDYREVMPGVLYRGGANNGHAPLREDQLKALCEAGFGCAVYLYRTGFSGPSTVQCSKGSLRYITEGWEGKGRAAVNQQIYDVIQSKDKPIFIDCWNGIPATGAAAATALMQFCNTSPAGGCCVLESGDRPLGAISVRYSQYRELPEKPRA